MSIQNLSKLVGQISKSIGDSEKIATIFLKAKLQKFASAYPTDLTIGKIADVIEKASDKRFYITKGELKDLYTRLYSRNTKFAQLFADELGLEQQEEVVKKPNDTVVELSTEGFADSLLATALESAFDKSIPLRPYSKESASKAKTAVASSLESWNLKASNVNVADGNEKFIVIKADYETPKGVTSFFVPVNVESKHVEANLFLGNSGPLELNHSNVKNYISKSAGLKLNVSALEVLDVLNVTSKNLEEVSPIEFAAIKVNAAKKQKSDFFANGIIGQELEKTASSDVVLEKSEESDLFSKRLETPDGLASLTLGDASVKIGSELITKTLNSFGFKYPSIKVIASNSNTISYGVSLDAGKVAFTVPVKVNEGKVLIPTIMVCAGSVSDFSKKSISDLYASGKSDRKVAAVTSPSYGLKPSELIENIRNAVMSDNFAKAEDSLNILKEAGDEKAYAIGFQVFTDGLAGNIKAAAPSKCSMIIKSAVSKHELCGHTGKPLHEVYQDNHGNCRPTYRKNMSETFEGAVFNNHKIFF
jgi:hypothetical protein